MLQPAKDVSTAKEWADMLSSLPFLSRLSVVAHTIRGSLVHAVLSSAPGLKSLKLQDKKGLWIPEMLQGLALIHSSETNTLQQPSSPPHGCEAYPGASSASAGPAAPALPNLTSLSINNPNTPLFDLSMVTGSSQLTSLVVDGARSEAWEGWVERLPQLKLLSFHTTSINDVAWELLLSRTNLTELRINHLEKATESGGGSDGAAGGPSFYGRTSSGHVTASSAPTPSTAGSYGQAPHAPDTSGQGFPAPETHGQGPPAHESHGHASLDPETDGQGPPPVGQLSLGGSSPTQPSLVLPLLRNLKICLNSPSELQALVVGGLPLLTSLHLSFASLETPALGPGATGEEGLGQGDDDQDGPGQVLSGSLFGIASSKLKILSALVPQTLTSLSLLNVGFDTETAIQLPPGLKQLSYKWNALNLLAAVAICTGLLDLRLNLPVLAAVACCSRLLELRLNLLCECCLGSREPSADRQTFCELNVSVFYPCSLLAAVACCSRLLELRLSLLCECCLGSREQSSNWQTSCELNAAISSHVRLLAAVAACTGLLELRLHLPLLAAVAACTGLLELRLNLPCLETLDIELSVQFGRKSHLAKYNAMLKGISGLTSLQQLCLQVWDLWSDSALCDSEYCLHMLQAVPPAPYRSVAAVASNSSAYKCGSWDGIERPMFDDGLQHMDETLEVQVEMSEADSDDLAALQELELQIAEEEMGN
eukprot:gene29673-5088_t